MPINLTVQIANVDESSKRRNTNRVNCFYANTWPSKQVMNHGPVKISETASNSEQTEDCLL